MATIGQSRQRLAGPVMVGDDHVDAEPQRLLHLGDGGDAAVDGENELHALLGEARDRRARDAVPLLEPTREVPDDVGAELAEGQRRERRRADPVDVVVAVHADPLSAFDSGSEPLDGCRHVTEEERIVRDSLGIEERPRRRRDRASPRRTSTLATVSETPSSSVSARTSGYETDSIFQLAPMEPR